eukprot:RCo026183
MNKMKNMIRNSLVVLASALVLNAAQAAGGDGNGGLMTQMMAKKYQPQVITEPAVQARLSKVQIADDGYQNGGLMKQLMASRYSGRVITDEKAQEQLSQVRIAAGSGNGD